MTHFFKISNANLCFFKKTRGGPSIHPAQHMKTGNRGEHRPITRCCLLLWKEKLFLFLPGIRETLAILFLQ